MAPDGRDLTRAEILTWPTPGAGAQPKVAYAATVPARIGDLQVERAGDVAAECAAASLDLAVFARAQRRDNSADRGVGLVLAAAETLASCQVDGSLVTAHEWAAASSGEPATRAARDAVDAVDALAAHRTAAVRALGLGAFAAAHRAPYIGPGGARGFQYRQAQTWIGGTDLWPRGAAYVPPQPLRVPDLMGDLVEFCARTDIDPVAQAALAHAQLLSIQPFERANGRVARTVMQGVFCRRGFSDAPVVPLSASFKGDLQRVDKAWTAFREGDPAPILRLVARHTIRALAEATASGDRVRELPAEWRFQARPRRGSAAHRLIDHLASSPVVRVADVQRLTGASLASAYDAIVRLAEAGVLQRLSRGKRDSVWVAVAVLEEIDHVLARLARPV